MVGKTELRQVIGPEHVTHIDDHRRRHHASNPRHVDALEFLPFGHDHEHIRTPRSGAGIRRRMHPVPPDCAYRGETFRIVEANLCARIEQRCEILMSPVYGKLAPRDLAEWILADRLPVRLQIQLHKALWGEEQGR